MCKQLLIISLGKLKHYFDLTVIPVTCAQNKSLLIFKSKSYKAYSR